MSDFSVTTTGIDRVARAGVTASTVLGGEMVTIANAAAKAGAAASQGVAPVLTGELRGSIGPQPATRSGPTAQAAWAATADHAVPVDQGHWTRGRASFVGGRFFMRAGIPAARRALHAGGLAAARKVAAAFGGGG